MALKAPGILIFTLSIIVSLAVLFARFFGSNVPLLTADTTQFYAMWGAYLVLVFGCVMRGLWDASHPCTVARGRDVPICRAAFGALERLVLPRSLSAMEREPTFRRARAQRRVRRWAREILLAAMLTAAAAAFIRPRCCGAMMPPRRSAIRDRTETNSQ